MCQLINEYMLKIDYFIIISADLIYIKEDINIF